MSDPTPEDVSFAADLDRLRAAVGPARLEEIAALDAVWDSTDNTDLIDATLLFLFEDLPIPPDLIADEKSNE